ATVPATRIYTMADIFRDPHFRAREMLAQVPDEELGSVTVANVVPRLSETPGRIRWSGGRIGQDTRQVLTDVAGLSAQDIGRLATAGVVCCDDHPASEEDLVVDERAGAA
ncbi:MAG: hypothetical protein DI537_58520, partial [Stutzerimonas stutzeri]